jgi:hypothetical protein
VQQLLTFWRNILAKFSECKRTRIVKIQPIEDMWRETGKGRQEEPANQSQGLLTYLLHGAESFLRR